MRRLANLDQILTEEENRAKLNSLLGHDGVDGTYYYCLTRVKEAFHVGTMTLDDFVEINEEFTDEILRLFQPQIDSLNERCKQHVVENDNQNAEIEMRKKYESFLRSVIRSGEQLKEEHGFEWFVEHLKTAAKEYGYDYKTRNEKTVGQAV